jgi:hypothetical protein
MSGVFQNIDPPPPSPPGECVPPAFDAGEDTLTGGEGGGGSIFWKTPDTALCSSYVSTLWLRLINSQLDFIFQHFFTRGGGSALFFLCLQETLNEKCYLFLFALLFFLQCIGGSRHIVFIKVWWPDGHIVFIIEAWTSWLMHC